MSELHDGETNLAKRIVSGGRSMVSFAVVLCAWMLPSLALAFNLVTEQEAKASALYEAANPASELAARAFDPMGPRIEIISPDLSSSAPLQSPLAIIVKFQSLGGAEILPESFRAQYGVFRLDITERLLKATKVTKEGIRVDRAELPGGSHRLFLKVQDNADRTGEREVRFTVQ